MGEKDTNEMIVQETVQQILQASLTDRIQVMELLLQSLKAEIIQDAPSQKIYKPFRVRTFNLGAEIDIDRKEMKS